NNADRVPCTSETCPETNGGCTLAAPPFLVGQHNDLCASKLHRRAFQKKFVYLHTVYLYTSIPPYFSQALYTKNNLIQQQLTEPASIPPHNLPLYLYTPILFLVKAITVILLFYAS